MIFDPQKRITPAHALKHPYFDGFVLNTNPKPTLATDATIEGKTFMNANNEF